MAEIHIDMNDVETTIIDILRKYGSEVFEGVRKESKKIAKNAVRKIRIKSPKGRYPHITASGESRKPGQYADGWRNKETKKDRYAVEQTIYNKTDWRLTHLLENGHALRQGGRSPAIPHISPVEKEVIEDFERGCEEVIKNAGY